MVCFEVGDFYSVVVFIDGGVDGFLLAFRCEEALKNRFSGALRITAWRTAMYGGRVD